MIDKLPRLIVRCADVADVIAAVNFARQNSLLVAVPSGGHSGGVGLRNDVMVIDLSAMRGVRVDPEAGTVRVDGGSTWGEVHHAAGYFGLAVPSGIISTASVGEITLSGGIGYVTRKYGLTIDNLLEADVVLADGNLLKASEEENEDLFWAIRGGGGNFGVVTSFLFRGNPVREVYAGPMLWELDRAEEIMRWYRDFSLQAPEDLFGFFAFLIVPPAPLFPEHLHNKNMCGVVWCYSGALEEAEDAFRPIREEVGPAAFESLGPMTLPYLNSLYDDVYPQRLQCYWSEDFLNELSDEAVAAHLKYGSEIPTMFSTMHLYPVNGAVHRAGSHDTAFSYRDASWAQVIIGIHPHPAYTEHVTAWAESYWEALCPYYAGGPYVKFMQ